MAYTRIVNGGVIGLGMALSLLILQTKSEKEVDIYIEDLKRLENAIEELGEKSPPFYMEEVSTGAIEVLKALGTSLSNGTQSKEGEK